MSAFHRGMPFGPQVFDPENLANGTLFGLRVGPKGRSVWKIVHDYETAKRIVEAENVTAWGWSHPASWFVATSVDIGLSDGSERRLDSYTELQAALAETGATVEWYAIPKKVAA